MSSLCDFHKSNFILFLVGYLIFIISSICEYTQAEDYENNLEQIRSGKYIPQVFGSYRGKYIPDDSGRYHHKFIPYTGGYGDNGVSYTTPEPYTQRQPPPFQLGYDDQVFIPYSNRYGGNGMSYFTPKPSIQRKPPFQLGYDDHLRLLLDYNYQSGGWQIVQFDWTRDDEYGNPQPKYSYKNKVKLWQTADDEMIEEPDSSGYEYSENIGNGTETSGVPNDMENKYGFDFDYQTEGESVTMIYDYADLERTTEEANQEEVHQAIGDVLDYVKSNLLPNFM